MQIVAGISLKNLNPRVWDVLSPYYLPQLEAIMISYADFHCNAVARKKAMNIGLRAFLNAPEHIRIYLDNGAFYFIGHNGETPRKEYEEFVATAKPDWWPIPQDFIPIPHMAETEQENCFKRTMDMNLDYQHDGFVPVIHISPLLEKYTIAVQEHSRLIAKKTIALGGIVPNLLRAPKAMKHSEVLESLKHVRHTFADKRLHVFGIGGTATLHIAALLSLDSIDSSGWRNRAARGLIQLPGSGDRMVAELGSWRGRKPSPEEWEKLESCQCPPCQKDGVEGLIKSGTAGFCHRATHNLWILLNESHWIEDRLTTGDYKETYKSRLDNSTYLPIIKQLIDPEPPNSVQEDTP